ncbi:hypothetical protein FRB91_008001 [Serendipita sp. 411]|nr:hypothetical protein FRB91_008001 [Serendipita sp. 411]
MFQRENDDYMPDEGHLVSGRPRKPKHMEAGGPGGRPGQRGKNKREHGEKPVVSVKWSPQLTEQLWALIKANNELKRVLVNEPTRFLGPHGAVTQLFSKKDLQQTIAKELFDDGSYNLLDPVVMSNLTRAVKNKLHKTQMLYEDSQKQMPPEFMEYQSEDQVPVELHAKWVKIKDRFPTYFEYHELAQEIPAITSQMELDAQAIGAWKAKALSGSEGGSPNSFISNRHRSRSVDTSASYEIPEPENFEVLPPPIDNQVVYSDVEPYGISPRPAGLQLQSFNNGSPLANWGPNASGTMGPGISPVGAGPRTPLVINPAFRGSSDDIAAPWNPLVEPSITNTLTNEPGSFEVVPPGGGWQATQSPLVASTKQTHYSAVPFQQDGQSFAQISTGNSQMIRKRHERHVSADGFSRADVPPNSVPPSVSPQPASPFSNVDYSSSGSPDMPMSADSQDERALESLLRILKAREERKRRNQDEWLRLKKRKLDDREKQRLENQRQREENERQRQHESRMLEHQLKLAQMAEDQRHVRSGSIPTASASSVASPNNLDHQDTLMGFYSGSHQVGILDSRDTQFNEMMLLQQLSGQPRTFDSRTQQQQSQQSSSQQQQQQSMGLSGALDGYMHAPPQHVDMGDAVTSQTFHGDQFRDLFGPGMTGSRP